MNTIKCILATLTLVLFEGTSVANAAGFAESSFMQHQTMAYMEESMYQMAFKEVKRVATSNNRNSITAQVLEGRVWNTYTILNPVRVEPETKEILLAYGPSKRVGRDKQVILVDNDMDGTPDYSLSNCATGCVRASATEGDKAEFRKRVLMVFSYIEDQGL